jgi:hypothetical protein
MTGLGVPLGSLALVHLTLLLRISVSVWASWCIV